MQLITRLEEFAALEADWDRLVAGQASSSVFNGWVWNRLWWTHYGHLGELFVLAVYRGHCCVAIAPLYRRTVRLLKMIPVSTISFIGTGGDTSPDDLDILVQPDEATSVAEALVSSLCDGDSASRLHLSDMQLSSAFLDTLLNRLASGGGYLRPVVHSHRRVQTLARDKAGWRAQLSRNTHKQIKRRRNKLDRAGHAEFRLCETSAEVVEAREALVRLHRARWQDKGQPGAFSSTSYLEFHEALMDQLHAREELWLLTLRVSGAIVGVEYGFRHGGTLAFFQTGFDPAFEALSPGHLMMAESIERAMDLGLERIDLLKGDYEYKASYATESTTTVTVDWLRPEWRSRTVATLDALRRWLQRPAVR